VPDWLQTPFQADAELSLTMLVIRLVSSFALGCVVAAVYRFTHGGPGGQSRGLMATLVLLTVLICMMTLVIGNNVARAFSLVGALAIVRFRTVVEDTRDTAFVIFAVSVGMAVGAGFLKIPLVAIPITALAAFVFHARNGASANGAEHELCLRVAPGVVSESTVNDLIAAHVAASHVKSMGTARQGAAWKRPTPSASGTRTASAALSKA
jgi:hypothetical protein